MYKFPICIWYFFDPEYLQNEKYSAKGKIGKIVEIYHSWLPWLHYFWLSPALLLIELQGST